MKADNRNANQWRASQPGGFTLIELLVVIAIIGILASLSLVVTGAINSKSKKTRVTGEMKKLETAIESYRAELGSLPPDNPGYPSTNQLYYELSGMLYEKTGAAGRFQTPGKEATLSESFISDVFNVSSFANAVKVPATAADIRYKADIKANQHKTVDASKWGQEVEMLAVPVEGPTNFVAYPVHSSISRELLFPQKGSGPGAPSAQKINPWLYDVSTTNRNNRGVGQYDFWAETVIGKKRVRFSNWERTPVTVK